MAERVRRARHSAYTLSSVPKSCHYPHAQVKCLMLQLLAGVAYLHENWVLHRDLKTSNILYNNRGELKVRLQSPSARARSSQSVRKCINMCVCSWCHHQTSLQYARIRVLVLLYSWVTYL